MGLLSGPVREEAFKGITDWTVESCKQKCADTTDCIGITFGPKVMYNWQDWYNPWNPYQWGTHFAPTCRLHTTFSPHDTTGGPTADQFGEGCNRNQDSCLWIWRGHGGGTFIDGTVLPAAQHGTSSEFQTCYSGQLVFGKGTEAPTSAPSFTPTETPTTLPPTTNQPSFTPTPAPTEQPSAIPTATPTHDPVSQYTVTFGACRGGARWPNGNLWDCHKPNDKTIAECESICNSTPGCGGFETNIGEGAQRPNDSTGQCCLYAEGHTGNGELTGRGARKNCHSKANPTPAST